MIPDIIIIRIKYNIEDPSLSVIQTNAKTEALEELLSAYLSSIIGAGSDNSEPNQLMEYTITIGVSLSDDSFNVQSDTGNKGLRDGIILSVFRYLDTFNIEDLDGTKRIKPQVEVPTTIEEEDTDDRY